MSIEDPRFNTTVTYVDSGPYLPGQVSPGSIDSRAYGTYIESEYAPGEIEEARQDLQNNPARVNLT